MKQKLNTRVKGEGKNNCERIKMKQKGRGGHANWVTVFISNANI